MQLDMTKGRPLPVILQFTLPLIIGNIFQQLYNMVDTIIVGRYVGADALAAHRFFPGYYCRICHSDFSAIWCPRCRWRETGSC